MVCHTPKSAVIGLQQHNKRILLVDDEPTSPKLLSALLEKRGFETRSINDSRLALSTAQEFQPEVILLDISMPHVDGYEVARSIRREPHINETPIIAVTSLDHDEHKHQTAAAGIEHQLTKPCDIRKLVELIDEVAI